MEKEKNRHWILQYHLNIEAVYAPLPHRHISMGYTQTHLVRNCSVINLKDLRCSTSLQNVETFLLPLEASGRSTRTSQEGSGCDYRESLLVFEFHFSRKDELSEHIIPSFYLIGFRLAFLGLRSQCATRARACMVAEYNTCWF